MASRKHIPLAHEGRSLPGPGLIHHGLLPVGHRPMEPLPPPELLENRLAVQASDIEQLAGDNHRLGATHLALRQDLIAAQQEIQRLAEHIRTVQTESDIQIRVSMDKISKMEVEIRAGESVKKDLPQTLTEARSLASAVQELTAQIQQATQELEKARAAIKRLPEMNAELDSLRQEHQRLRTTFEYEKGLNIEKVEKMRIMEKDIVGMAGEVERLRAEVLNAEKRAQAPNPYGGAYISPPIYPPMHGSNLYINHYGGPPVQMATGAIGQGMIPYGSGTAAAPLGGAEGAAAADAGGYPAWGRTYDASHAMR